MGVQNPEADSQELKDMKELLGNYTKTEQLFSDIAKSVSSAQKGRLNSTSTINVRNLVNVSPRRIY